MWKYVYTISNKPPYATGLLWIKKLFFSLNLCEIVHATIICTKQSCLKKKKEKEKIDFKQC